jgi:hypothetical protein
MWNMDTAFEIQIVTFVHGGFTSLSTVFCKLHVAMSPFAQPKTLSQLVSPFRAAHTFPEAVYGLHYLIVHFEQVPRFVIGYQILQRRRAVQKKHTSAEPCTHIINRETTP